MKMVCAVLRFWPAQHLFLLGQLPDNVRVRYQSLKLSIILEYHGFVSFSWQQQQESEQHNNWDHLEILSSSYCHPCVWWVTVTDGAVIAFCCDNSPSSSTNFCVLVEMIWISGIKKKSFKTERQRFHKSKVSFFKKADSILRLYHTMIHILTVEMV